ncbi:MAG: PAS domain S-box protein [Nitrospinaceae bacterium]|jgi:PAS domain S-box-containing protein|nr:PAS domain S-box protein [Nitrospinaceae bacterium]MBT3435311.1 PAS domain S-box protein [Nitrospinaceae bacterium]MBT4432655.1 PAS domain S-box protein [Nitrospinaceae bacterium]MBT5369908.1 PAS domain S-box protein [Nitrospinaceae bacterium]MBT5948686.1 PAS domain S-box protein [Nitrospinaceae bacterium]
MVERAMAAQNVTKEPVNGENSGIQESRRVNRRFQYFVVLGVTAVLIVLITISLKIHSGATRDIEYQFNRQQLLIADQASGRIASFLDELSASLRYSARFLRTVGPDHPGRMSSIAGLFERLGGRLRVSEVGYLSENSGSLDLTNQEYAALLSQCSSRVRFCFLIVRKNGKPKYIFDAAPVGGGDWLYVKVTLDDLGTSFVDPVQSGLKGRAWLLDASGRILFAPGFRMFEGKRIGDIAERLGDERLKRIAVQMRQGGRGFEWHHDFRPGKVTRRGRTLTAFSPILVGQEQWTLAVTASSSEVGDLVRRVFRKSFILTSFGFVVIVVAALLLLDRERRRIRMENRLHWSGQVLESKTRLQALFDGITDSICILDKNFKILTVNREMSRFLGCEIADLLYRTWSGEGDGVFPEGLADHNVVEHTFESGQRGFADRSVLMPDGKRRDIELYSYPIFSSEGPVRQVILYIKDVTERRELEQQLLQQERLSIVGKMSAQVAHEIRNPLSAINLNSELLGDELGAFDDEKTSEAWALLRSIRHEVDILRQVTDDYLKFVRMPRSERRVGFINDVFDELLSFYSEEASSRKIRIERELSLDAPEVEFDETQIRLALQNLILNAFDAMPNGGRLTVRTRPGPEGGVGIDVEDEGVGIPAGEQAFLFTPFFTTKASGTGLGLVLTQQILTEHRASIRFSSQEGAGTTFHIEFPAVAPVETKA